MTVIWGILIAGLVVVGGYALLSGGKSSPSGAPVPISSSPTPAVSSPASEMTEIEVVGTEFAFAPKALSVTKGDKVRINFKNSGKFPHNLTVDELGIASKTINPGETDVVELTVDKTGTFPMYCSVDTHRQQGMEGSVTVK